MKKMIKTFSFLLLSLSFCYVSFGQKPPEITVKDIDVELKLAPKYSVEGANIQREADKKWLVVEASLECHPEWSNEITLKYYVAANYSSSAKGDEIPADRYDVLSTSVTVVNVPGNMGTGKKNLVPVFIDANTVKRYGASQLAQFIPSVAVEVWYKGALQDLKWWKGKLNGQRFWERKAPRTGILLNLAQSPWTPGYVDHYEQLKATGTSNP